MQTIGERILGIKKHFYGEGYGSNASFAKKIGVSSQVVSNWFGRGDGIGDNVIKQILDVFPQIDKGWLVGGNGSMIKDGNSIESEAQPQGDMSMEDELAHWQTLATNLQTTASSLVQIIQGMQKEKEEIIQVMRSIQEENLKLVDELRKEKVG